MHMHIDESKRGSFGRRWTERIEVENEREGRSEVSVRES